MALKTVMETRMNQFVFKMPDLGEGTVDAEIVAWHTKPGDAVTEDQLIVEVMTDKAAVEVPAPVSGRVVSITGAPGDKVAVGSPLIVFDVGENGHAPAPRHAAHAAHAAPTAAVAAGAAPAAQQGRVMASPANRRRAREAGIDLSTVVGSGPGGRILRDDLAAAGTAPRARQITETSEIKVIGLRRLIAERMSEAKRTIPHFAYVEEVDVTELESLRQHLNQSRPAEAASLSYLPLVVMALVRVLDSFPQCNVLYDAARGVLVRHRAVHVGIATQTPDGLKVPVVRNAEHLGLWEVGRRDPASRRTGAQQQGDARGAHRVHHHGDQSRQTRRHRLDPHHQCTGSRHHRAQQGDRAADGLSRQR